MVEAAGKARADDRVGDATGLPDVVDGSAVQGQIEGRRIDPGAVVTDGDRHGQHIAVAERSAIRGLGEPSAGGVLSGTLSWALPSVRLPAPSPIDHVRTCGP